MLEAGLQTEWQRNVEALLLDVHLTLVDDSHFPHHELPKLLRAEGVQIPDAELQTAYVRASDQVFDWPSLPPRTKIRDLHGRRLRRLYELLRLNRDPGRDLEILYQRMRRCRLYPDAVEVLPLLHGRYRLAVVSNADEDDPLLVALRPVKHLFEAVVVSGEVGVLKPSSRIFQIACEKLGVEAERAAVVGDSPTSDVLGAHRAGLRAIWLNRKNRPWPTEIPEPDAVVRDFYELRDLLLPQRTA